MVHLVEVSGNGLLQSRRVRWPPPGTWGITRRKCPGLCPHHVDGRCNAFSGDFDHSWARAMLHWFPTAHASTAPTPTRLFSCRQKSQEPGCCKERCSFPWQPPLAQDSPRRPLSQEWDASCVALRVLRAGTCAHGVHADPPFVCNQRSQGSGCCR